MLKTTLDCISRILLFSAWLYVIHDGQFSSSKTVIAYYFTFMVLVVFNIIFNNRDEYNSARTWTGLIERKLDISNRFFLTEIIFNSSSSVLSYNSFNFKEVFDHEKRISEKKRELHEPTFMKQLLYFLIFTSLFIG